MNEKEIRKYAELMKELDLSALEINEKDGTVRLERAAAPVQLAAAPVPAAAAVKAEAPAPAAAAPAETGEIIVRSPMVGVFYAAPSESSDPFVKVGDKVTKGTTLCIVEAMKLMNELPAEQDGIITEICVQNGQIVDYGCELFKMKIA